MATAYEIHPAIGIARAGNSTDFFVGPEPGGAPPARYRDGGGSLLRQAARFRILRCDRDAHGVLRSATEVTAAHATIEWTVHLANGKAAAPEFPPSPSKAPVAGGRLRNPGQANRAALVIDPGPATVAGANQRHALDGGTFLGVPVPLGEVRTDADGRLLVLGGFGTSGSAPPGTPAPITHFANNDHWFDDMSDGSVTATVKVGARGRKTPAKPAWLICAPPDFAPPVANFVTLYDVAYQAAVDRGWRTVPDQPSFTRDVQPILARAVGYQWVLELGRRGHAAGSGMGDFASQWAMLADPSSGTAPMRQAVLRVLRDPSKPATGDDTGFMPRLHASDYAVFPNHVLRPTATQYAVMTQWAAGHFVSDLDHPPADIELLPDALDRVALQACSGGPFFPGIEVWGVMADPATYSEPFRVDAAAHRPGQLTQGNAVPWQADFLACSTDAHAQLGWWPAQRPYQVLPSPEATTSQFWHRGITGYRGMVDQWHELGVVVEARAPDGRTVFVESERRHPSG